MTFMGASYAWREVTLILDERLCVVKNCLYLVKMHEKYITGKGKLCLRAHSSTLLYICKKKMRLSFKCIFIKLSVYVFFSYECFMSVWALYLYLAMLRPVCTWGTAVKPSVAANNPYKTVIRIHSIYMDAAFYQWVNRFHRLSNDSKTASLSSFSQ